MSTVTVLSGGRRRRRRRIPWRDLLVTWGIVAVVLLVDVAIVVGVLALVR